MTHIIKKGTLVKSITYEDGKDPQVINYGPIIFDYEFTDEEFVSTNSERTLFTRKSEDGKFHDYYVKN